MREDRRPRGAGSALRYPANAARPYRAEGRLSEHPAVTMLFVGLFAGFVLGLVIMAAIGILEWERGFRAGGGRQGRDRVTRERLAAHSLRHAA